MREGRKQGKSPKRVELERAQQLKSEGIKSERVSLRQAVICLSKNSRYISLGIMADAGASAIEALKAWVTSLGLPRGVLFASDDSGVEVSVDSLLNAPAFIKYNSSNSSSASLKKYKSDGFVGVIFQPVLEDGEFRQYGDLPLKLF